jgi:hypothetical protein
MGAQVIPACRNRDRGEAAAEEILATTGRSDLFACGGCECRLAGLGELDLVAARAQVGRESAQDLGFVVDGDPHQQDRGGQAGYLTKIRDGRRSRYQIHEELPLRHPAHRHHTVGELIRLLEAPRDPAARGKPRRRTH